MELPQSTPLRDYLTQSAVPHALPRAVVIANMPGTIGPSRIPVATAAPVPLLQFVTVIRRRATLP